MVQSFNLGLDTAFQRPVVQLEKNILAMLDTGALFPVWVASEENLKALGGVKISDSVSFGGLGGKLNGKVYRLDEFKVGDLVYRPLNIVVTKLIGNEPTVHMLLSATMFSDLKYEIDNKRHLMTVTIPDGESLERRVIVQDNGTQWQVLAGSV